MSSIKIKNADGVYAPITVMVTGTDTSDATATAADILAGKTAYKGGAKVTGSIPTYSGGNTISSNGTVSVAGKYCAEDLSVEVAGSGGEGNVTTGTTFSVSL